MAGNMYGLDFGSYEIKLYNKKEETFSKVKDALAIKGRSEVLAVGDTAYEMYEKSPSGIEIIFPMKEGVVSRFHDMQHILNNIFKETKTSFFNPNYLIAVPTDVTEVEKKAFYDLLTQSIARSKNVSVVERSIADAVGIGIDIKDEPGAFVINMGAQTTEMSILASDGLVLNKLLKKGAYHMDLEIQNAIKQKEEFYIGQLTAQQLRHHFGMNFDKKRKDLKVTGRNLLTGIPEFREISSDSVEQGINIVLEEILQHIISILERTPPLILKNIKNNGLFVCGGVANTSGIQEYLSNKLGFSVHIVRNPELNTVNGLAEIIKTKELRSLAYTMTNGNYRWMR